MDLQENEPFEFATRIRYSEVGESGLATLPAVIDLFQDCSTFQSETLGVGMAWLKEMRRGWFLTHWHVVVDRRPELFENVVVGTFAQCFKGVTASRDFYLRDESGVLIVRARSKWAFVDLDSGRPVRPTPEHVEPYGLHEPLDMPEAPRKIARPEELQDCEPFPILRHQIDTNGHVNNCEYVRTALDILPDSAFDRVESARELRIDYRHAAVIGDALCPKVAVDDERVFVELCDAEGDVFATLELR